LRWSRIGNKGIAGTGETFAFPLDVFCYIEVKYADDLVCLKLGFRDRFAGNLIEVFSRTGFGEPRQLSVDAQIRCLAMHPDLTGIAYRDTTPRLRGIIDDILVPSISLCQCITMTDLYQIGLF
jgi:hypothetical protein